ncbi:MAG: hypothetical protein ACP5LM_05415 [Thermoplasmata archaeon]|jgi:uncharacterized membrane protein
MINPGIFLGALGITLLEISEAAAITVALYSVGGNKAIYGTSLGVFIVFVITFIIGNLISNLPILLVKIVSGALLLYFGIRLIKSARKSVLRERNGLKSEEHFEKGVFYTTFSVGVVEAFEAAIVLVALIPYDLYASLLGVIIAIIIIIIAAYILRNQIRKLKQAIVKNIVSAILLSFSLFWFTESVNLIIKNSIPSIFLMDYILIPYFILFFLISYSIAFKK